jgi:hypothetical protein
MIRLRLRFRFRKDFFLPSTSALTFEYEMRRRQDGKERETLGEDDG